MSLRVDLEVATQGLRVGVKVKASSLEKALLPTGTVRLLELYFRGSVSIRAELRDEFPFVGKVSERVTQYFLLSVVLAQAAIAATLPAPIKSHQMSQMTNFAQTMTQLPELPAVGKPSTKSSKRLRSFQGQLLPCAVVCEVNPFLPPLLLLPPPHLVSRFFLRLTTHQMSK